MNWKAQKQMERDVEEHKEMYEAMADVEVQDG